MTTEGPFEALCGQPHDLRGFAKARQSTVELLPGVDILNLYRLSEQSDIWKDGEVTPCLVPRQLIGWEFYSLLWPQPDGASPLRLSATVSLLVGRRPGAPACPSLLFAHVQAGHLYAGSAGMGPMDRGGAPSQRKDGPEGRGRLAQTFERLSGNLDFAHRTIMPRMAVLCPSAIYKDAAVLPDEQNWGLFIGPRSRTLVLLNRHRGRIDLHLAALLGLDAAFNFGADLISATSRLFKPFGSQDQVPALFGPHFDPLKIHSGLTNAIMADHVREQKDGREDYLKLFNVRLPSFFLSNASSNLCFVTLGEAQNVRAGRGTAVRMQLPEPAPLPDVPRWTLHGPFSAAGLRELQDYRNRVPLLPANPTTSVGGLMQWLGLASCNDVAYGDESTASQSSRKESAGGGRFAYNADSAQSSLRSPAKADSGGYAPIAAPWSLPAGGGGGYDYGGGYGDGGRSYGGGSGGFGDSGGGGKSGYGAQHQVPPAWEPEPIVH
mmetsp:Transcript_7446/g.15469  ORF Transcript_7446/g.15469 Transcript_7446/m.15469 type:complete len:492 (-) Transcript_7446:108-1583(-)